MPGYDASQYEPPAPIASVTLRHPDDATRFTDCLLLIDTGADVTLLPRAAVERIGIPLIANVQYQLAAFDGTQTTAPAALVDMLFLNRIYRGRYVLIDAEHGVLGRDVLNHLRLFFDGPAQTWSQPSA